MSFNLSPLRRIFAARENASPTKSSHGLVGSFLVVLSMMPSSLVRAELADKGMHPYVETQIEYDSNVFGLPDAAAGRARGLTELSDISRTVRAGLLLDYQLSRQEITADLSIDRLRHARFQELDTDGRNLQANWKWHFSPHLDGDIGGSNTRALAQYITSNVPVKNVLNEKTSNASVNLRLHPSWHLSLGVEKYDLTPEAANANVGRRREQSTVAGVHYAPASGNSAALQLRSSHGVESDDASSTPVAGEYAFDQKALQLKLDWTLTAKTRIQFVGGPVRRTYEAASARNYSGANARFIVDYKISEKSGLGMVFWHELGVPDRFTTVSSLNDGISFSPRWKITEKTRLDGEFWIERRSFSEVGENAAGLSLPDDYRLRIAALNLIYQPLNNMELRSRVSVLSKLGNAPANRFNRRNILFTAQYHY